MCIDVGTFRQLNKQLQHERQNVICAAQEAPARRSSQLPQPCWKHQDTRGVPSHLVTPRLWSPPAVPLQCLQGRAENRKEPGKVKYKEGDSQALGMLQRCKHPCVSAHINNVRTGLYPKCPYPETNNWQPETVSTAVLK